MASHIARRKFLATLGGAAAAWPVGARAQQPPMPVIGFLRSTTEAGFAQLVAALRQGLKEAGFVEGQNVAIDFRWGDGQLDRLPGLADDLVRRQVALIVGSGLPSALAAKAATTTVPIVFVTAGDPVRVGLVANLNRPGGNVTGVVFTSSDLTAKQLGLLHELVPKSTVIAALFDPGAPSAEFQMRDAEEAGRTLRRQVLIVKAADERDFAAAFGTIVQAGGGGLLVGGSAFFFSRRRQLATLAARHALPAISITRSFTEAGLLMSYGASQTDAYRRAGHYAGRILKGAKPADMPVELATKIDLVINLATAKALGVEIPDKLLALADEVIE
jgi:putative tryptophan/tyrosine transport system substrate-binding protein